LEKKGVFSPEKQQVGAEKKAFSVFAVFQILKGKFAHFFQLFKVQDLGVLYNFE